HRAFAGRSRRAFGAWRRRYAGCATLQVWTEHSIGNCVGEVVDAAGLWADRMVAIIVGFLGMFQYMGLSTATVKWSELTHDQVTSLFWMNIALSAAIALLTIAAAPLAAWFYKEPRLIGITIGYGIATLLMGFSIQHEAILIRQM